MRIALDCDSYKGQRVSVMGAAAIGFEEQELCPNPEFLDGDPAECLWLRLDDDLASSLEEVERGTYLMVDGLVACDGGHLSLNGGALEKILSVVQLPEASILWEAPGEAQASDPH